MHGAVFSRGQSVGAQHRSVDAPCRRRNKIASTITNARMPKKKKKKKKKKIKKKRRRRRKEEIISSYDDGVVSTTTSIYEDRSKSFPYLPLA